MPSFWCCDIAIYTEPALNLARFAFHPPNLPFLTPPSPTSNPQSTCFKMSSETTAQNDNTVALGTRRSKLARVQTDIVAEALRSTHSSININIKFSDPLGDRDKTSALYEMAAFQPNVGAKNAAAMAKSLWTGELEEMLETGEVDAVVHSLKDLATQLPDGLVLAAVLKREDPRDVLVLPKSLGSELATTTTHPMDREKEAEEAGILKEKTADELLRALPPGSVIGTSSLRRIAQLRRRFSHLKFEVLRGNVPTRLAKLDDPISQGTEAPIYAGAVLAAAGLIRLDLGDRISAYLDGSEAGAGVLYAVGQGAIGIEAREGDARVMGLLEKLDDRPTRLAISAERAMLRKLEGGCSVPVGVEANLSGSSLHVKATVVSVDGSKAVDVEETGTVNDIDDAEKLGVRIAELLVERGASEILDEINKERQKAIGISEEQTATGASA
jgi:hydroxymethylbilane synthase